MSDNWRIQAYRSVLRGIARSAPRNLITRATPDAEELGETLSPKDFIVIFNEASNDPFVGELGREVHHWDAVSVEDGWTRGTLPSTFERRNLICALLGLDEEGTRLLTELRPIYRNKNTLVQDEWPWDPWYTSERAAERAFYWPHYRDYLANVKNWNDNNITSLDVATDSIVSRLADPLRDEDYQSKGLVVGYVQSGKTANFTGVIAKAIDVGYRLIIVMTGTIEMLRSQTQRRIDMEMVGRQNIALEYRPEQYRAGGVDYQDDDAWIKRKFLDFGEKPSVGISRLTVHRKDYQRQFRTMQVQYLDSGVPLYNPKNLFATPVGLAIVKKNSSVLDKLVKDIQANQASFSEMPVLIIDDESDQASINTVDPAKVREATKNGKEIKARRAINAKIATLLDLLPRVQYVGYTATPFANVFTDPADPLGIFPRDFVLGLQRPRGYMGVEDFCDPDDLDDSIERTFENSNKKAFVRDLRATEDQKQEQHEELRIAIDAFVLAGAVKVYRKEVDPSLDFTHHTMLVHHAVTMNSHLEMAEVVRGLWREADFSSPNSALRLRNLYETDTQPVSLARLHETEDMAGDPLPRGMAPDFDDLWPHISTAVSKIIEHSNNPVLIVNSDKEIQAQQQDLDFTAPEGIWRILVGGAKLSRGFTVEGLTVTYFRRGTTMSDSLTQMGRWFGFRPGYRDLVRLYIARSARVRSSDQDLYNAFQNIALDESAFRAQLATYAEWKDGKPRVRPIQIPPLVYQHLSWLEPTAKDKMFNAVLVEASEQPLNPAGYPTDEGQLQLNLDVWRAILRCAQEERALPQQKQKAKFPCYLGIVPAEHLLSVIDQTTFLDLYKARYVQPRLAYLQRILSEGNLHDFVVAFPQAETADVVDITGVGLRHVISRDRRPGRGDLFGELSVPRQRWTFQQFVDGQGIPELDDLYSPTTGVVMVTIARESKRARKPSDGIETGLVLAFTVYAPLAATSSDDGVLRFSVMNNTKKDDASIDTKDAQTT